VATRAPQRDAITKELTDLSGVIHALAVPDTPPRPAPEHADAPTSPSQPSESPSTLADSATPARNPRPDHDTHEVPDNRSQPTMPTSLLDEMMRPE
jgi:hypothetical protein